MIAGCSGTFQTPMIRIKVNSEGVWPRANMERRMSEDGEGLQPQDLEAKIIVAFRGAYPEIPDGRLVHMARNFTQVLNGLISIGEMSGDERDVSHMDMTNGMVYSCVTSTFLEELLDGEWRPVPDAAPVRRISDEEMGRLQNEIVARVADWLLGLEVLKESDPAEFRNFVKGALALGAEGWERERGNLTY